MWAGEAGTATSAALVTAGGGDSFQANPPACEHEEESSFSELWDAAATLRSDLHFPTGMTFVFSPAYTGTLIPSLRPLAKGPEIRKGGFCAASWTKATGTAVHSLGPRVGGEGSPSRLPRESGCRRWGGGVEHESSLGLC